MISDRALHDLWAVFNAKRRKGSTVIKVEADSLGALLTTHHTLYSQLTASKKVEITLGPDHASMVSQLSAADFASLAKAVEQRAAFARSNNHQPVNAK
jgi:hypothetical protein